MTAIEQLLDVERFEPPEEFRAQALAGDSSLHRDADADYESWWERQAAELDWFDPWSQVLDRSDPPFAKWSRDPRERDGAPRPLLAAPARSSTPG